MCFILLIVADIFGCRMLMILILILFTLASIVCGCKYFILFYFFYFNIF